MSICASLVVHATLTRLPPCHISSPHVPPGVSSWATPLTTKAIAALISRQTAGAALHREVGGGAQATRSGPRAALNREAGTTPPPPLPCPFVGSQGVVGPVMPLDNPHRMITWGKTGFRVVPDHLVLTAMTSSPTPSPIPSSACAALTYLHWRVAMEEEYGALISNGTWEQVPQPQGSNVVTGK
jgi:hypothetical protein